MSDESTQLEKLQTAQNEHREVTEATWDVIKEQRGKSKVECSGSYMLTLTWERNKHFGVSDYMSYFVYGVTYRWEAL